MSIRIPDSCDKEHLRSDGGGQLWHSFGKNGKNGNKGVKKEGQHQNQNPNPKNQSGAGGSQNTGGKGKPKNLTGKGARTLEQGEKGAMVDSRSQLFRILSQHLDHEGWLRWTYDTGAAITAFPQDARIGTETQANECSNKTA